MAPAPTMPYPSRVCTEKLNLHQSATDELGFSCAMHAHLLRTLVCFVSFLLLGFGAAAQSQADAKRSDVSVPVYVFFSESCPHCTKARAFLSRLAERERRVRVVSLALSGDPRHEAAFADLSEIHRINPPAVPLIIVGESIFVGYGQDHTTGAEIEDVVSACLAEPCADPTAKLLSRHGISVLTVRSRQSLPNSVVKRPPLPEIITIPVLGEIKVDTLSLPMLTVLLAGIDGFNPCAMWVLVFLIGLLMGLQNPLRMWTYGSAFLLTSAAVYFVFLAAWLNIFLFLGALTWIRIAVGILALAAGGWYLAEFWRNR